MSTLPLIPPSFPLPSSWCSSYPWCPRSRYWQSPLRRAITPPAHPSRLASPNSRLRLLGSVGPPGSAWVLPSCAAAWSPCTQGAGPPFVSLPSGLTVLHCQHVIVQCVVSGFLCVSALFLTCPVSPLSPTLCPIIFSAASSRSKRTLRLCPSSLIGLFNSQDFS